MGNYCYCCYYCDYNNSNSYCWLLLHHCWHRSHCHCSGKVLPQGRNTLANAVCPSLRASTAVCPSLQGPTARDCALLPAGVQTEEDRWVWRSADSSKAPCRSQGCTSSSGQSLPGTSSLCPQGLACCHLGYSQSGCHCSKLCHCQGGCPAHGTGPRGFPALLPPQKRLLLMEGLLGN